MADVKTRKQVEYLLSEDSPLSPLERARLQREVKEGVVRVVPDRREQDYYENREQAGL